MSSCASFCFATCRAMLAVIAATSLAFESSLRPRTMTGSPARAATSTRPAPMVPDPQIPIVGRSSGMRRR